MKKILVLIFILSSCASANQIKFKIDNNISLKTGALIRGNIYLPQINAITTENKEIKSNDLKGKWKIFYFGYSRCPQICPNTLKNLNSILNHLSTPTKNKLETFFVSLDEKHDTPLKLKNFLSSNNNNSLVGITVNKDNLIKLKEIFKIKSETHNMRDGYVIINHTTSILLLSPQNKYIARFDPPLDIKSIASDLETIITNFRGTK